MKRKLIGLYELITGVFGFILVFSNIGKVLSDMELFFSFILGLILFGGLTFSGYALINKIKGGYRYSLLLQGLQSVSFVYSGVYYLFSGSAFMAVSYSLGQWSFEYQLSPIAYSVTKVSQGLSTEVNIYIVPIIILALLFTERGKIV